MICSEYIAEFARKMSTLNLSAFLRYLCKYRYDFLRQVIYASQWLDFR